MQWDRDTSRRHLHVQLVRVAMEPRRHTKRKGDSMSTTVWDMRIPCDADPACEHRVCHVCKNRLHTARQRKRDHPGTVPGVLRDLLCRRCKVIEGHPPYDGPRSRPKPKPDPLAQDESHILLSNKEMSRIRRDDPHMFFWHLARRKRLNARPPVLDESILQEQPATPKPPPVCSIEGCTKDAWSRGMCNTHYRRVLRHGDPHKLNYSRKDQTA